MSSEADLALRLLDDVADASDYAVVGPKDSRNHEIHTTRYPWNTVCHLGRDFGDGRWRGCSGALIGPRVVLTAGHCLYNHRMRRAPQRVRVSPGRADRDRFPYGSIVSTEFFVPRRYLRSRFPNIRDRRDFDYGVVVLPRPFPGISRFMRLAALPDAQFARLRDTKLLTVAGYPGDRPIGTMWSHTERLRRIAPQRLHYTMDTCPGHSGSPIWYLRKGDGENIIVGVHTSGIVDEQGRSYGCSPGTVMAPPGMMNSGVRINREVFADISNPSQRDRMVRVRSGLVPAQEGL